MKRGSRRVRSSRIPTTRWLALAALPLAGAYPPAHLAAQKGADVTRERLDNGLEVIVAPTGRVPLATIEVVVRGGAASQATSAEEGLPHVLEHMLFKTYGGTSGRSFGAYASELGATYNGTTDREKVTFYLTLPSDRLSGGVELMADLVSHPRLKGEALESEREVIRSELEQRVGDPYYLLDTYADRLLWGEGFRQRNPIGDLSSIMSARRGELEDYYRRFYVPENAAVVITGDVDPDEAVRLAREYFTGWEPGGSVPRSPEIPPSPVVADTIFIIEEDASEVTLLVRWACPGWKEAPEAAAAARLRTMVNLPMSGTQQRMVHTGIFEALAMRVEGGARSGSITLSGRTAPSNVAAAARALRQEIQILGQPWMLSAELFEVAKKHADVRAEIDAESGISRAHALARAWTRASLSDTDEVTLEDVQAFAQTWVQGRKRVIGILVPPDMQETGLLDDLAVAVEYWRSR